MRKDRRGNFIFDSKKTSLLDLIKFCNQEFLGTTFDQIYFPVPNGFYPENLEENDMVIGKIKHENINDFLGQEGKEYCFPVHPFVTLDFFIRKAIRVPNRSLAKTNLGWHKGQFYLIVEKI